MLGLLWASLPLFIVSASQVACDLDPEFDCTAHCLSDVVDNHDVDHPVSDRIHAADLGDAVTTCEAWLTCNEFADDYTSRFCTEVH